MNPTSSSIRRKTVVIIGGGLAGLAAAVRLIQMGHRPVVLEKRPFLGGRAFSFTDPETGVEVDNGQHVFVGACREYQQFLKDIGAWDRVRMPLRLDTLVLKGGAAARLRGPTNIRGEMANLIAVLGYGHLSFANRLRVICGLARIKYAKRLPGGPLEQETFDRWLLRHGQNDRTIRHFWDLIVLPALNDGIAAVSADAGLMLFQTALLGDPANAAIGYPVTGLTRLTGDPAQVAIARAGGEIRTGTEVEGIEFKGGQVGGVRLAGGEVVRGDAYIVALPAAALLDALPDEVQQSGFFAPARGIETSPIVGVHIWYDRPVMTEKFAAVLDSPLQWVFNVDAMQGDGSTPHHGPRPEGTRQGEGAVQDGPVSPGERGEKTGDAEAASGGQHIVISLSGAWRWRDLTKAELRETFVSEMAKVFPAARDTLVTRSLTVKMLDATFRSVPGSARHRLPQKTPIANLFLAGDWTATGWPSTMESAVRSGNLAAKAADSLLKSSLDHAAIDAALAAPVSTGQTFSQGQDGSAGAASLKRVLVLAPFDADSLAELRQECDAVVESWLDTGKLWDPEELGARIRDEKFDAVVAESDFLFAETFDAAPGLKFAGICRSALNQIDVAAATERGIVVVNTPGRNAVAVAEHTVGLMLAVARRTTESDRYVRGRRWESPSEPYRSLRGVELGGKVVGVVGLGAIGRRVASLCNAFGMHVVAYDPFVTRADAKAAGAVWSELDFLLESADFATLHAPPPRDGTPLLNAERLARMKQGATLVNTASAELVDQDALVAVLKSGRLRGAGLDVFPTHPIEPSSPLLSMENVVLTPHIGGATDGTIERHSAAMAVDLIRFKNGERPLHMVNPEVWEHRRA